MGGGTFDVSLLEIEEGVFEVKSTAGDTRLGGEDFTHSLVNLCLSDLQRKHQLVSKKGDNSDLISAKAQRRLWAQCEQAKKTISTSTKAMIEVDNILDDVDYTFTLTRAKFDETIQR